jgi:hypothetical protein
VCKSKDKGCRFTLLASIPIIPIKNVSINQTNNCSLLKKNDVISKTYLHFAPIGAHEQRQKHELVSALV